MAETLNDGTRVVRRGSTLANAFACLALLLSIVALVLAVRAHNQSERALQQLSATNDKIIKLTNRLDDAVGKNAITPATGNGTGTNNTVTPATGNTLPNANGQ